MKAFAEKTKQRLGIGTKVFEPTAIDHHHKLLTEAGEFAVALKAYQKSIDLDEHIADFFRSTGRFVSNAPPVREHGYNTNRELVPLQYAAPQDHAALYDRDLATHVFGQSPMVVQQKVNSGLRLPITQWLEVYENAKERITILDKQRLQLDSLRRKEERRERRRARRNRRTARIGDTELPNTGSGGYNAASGAAAGGVLPSTGSGGYNTAPGATAGGIVPGATAAGAGFIPTANRDAQGTHLGNIGGTAGQTAGYPNRGVFDEDYVEGASSEESEDSGDEGVGARGVGGAGLMQSSSTRYINNERLAGAMSAYEADDRNVNGQLTWLARQAEQLKASLLLFSLKLEHLFRDHEPSQGLLEPFPARLLESPPARTHQVPLNTLAAMEYANPTRSQEPLSAVLGSTQLTAANYDGYNTDRTARLGALPSPYPGAAGILGGGSAVGAPYAGGVSSGRQEGAGQYGAPAAGAAALGAGALGAGLLAHERGANTGVGSAAQPGVATGTGVGGVPDDRTVTQKLKDTVTGSNSRGINTEQGQTGYVGPAAMQQQPLGSGAVVPATEGHVGRDAALAAGAGGLGGAALAEHGRHKNKGVLPSEYATTAPGAQGAYVSPAATQQPAALAQQPLGTSTGVPATESHVGRDAALAAGAGGLGGAALAEHGRHHNRGQALPVETATGATGAPVGTGVAVPANESEIHRGRITDRLYESGRHHGAEDAAVAGAAGAGLGAVAAERRNNRDQQGTHLGNLGGTAGQTAGDYNVAGTPGYNGRVGSGVGGGNYGTAAGAAVPANESEIHRGRITDRLYESGRHHGAEDAAVAGAAGAGLGAVAAERRSNRDEQGTHLGNIGGTAGQTAGYNSGVGAGNYSNVGQEGYTGGVGSGSGNPYVNNGAGGVDNRTIGQKVKDAVVAPFTGNTSNQQGIGSNYNQTAATTGGGIGGGAVRDEHLGRDVALAGVGGAGLGAVAARGLNRDEQGTHTGNLGGTAGQTAGYNSGVGAGNYSNVGQEGYTGGVGSGSGNPYVNNGAGGGVDNRTIGQKVKDAVVAPFTGNTSNQQGVGSNYNQTAATTGGVGSGYSQTGGVGGGAVRDDHLGRDVALAGVGGAGLGAVAARGLNRDEQGTYTGNLGGTAGQTAGYSTGVGGNTGNNPYVAYPNQQGVGSEYYQTGATTGGAGSGYNQAGGAGVRNDHVGRDAALAGVGGAALGAVAAERRSNRDEQGTHLGNIGGTAGQTAGYGAGVGGNNYRTGREGYNEQRVGGYDDDGSYNPYLAGGAAGAAGEHRSVGQKIKEAVTGDRQQDDGAAGYTTTTIKPTADPKTLYTETAPPGQSAPGADFASGQNVSGTTSYPLGAGAATAGAATAAAGGSTGYPTTQGQYGSDSGYAPAAGAGTAGAGAYQSDVDSGTPAAGSAGVGDYSTADPANDTQPGGLLERMKNVAIVVAGATVGTVGGVAAGLGLVGGDHRDTSAAGGVSEYGPTDEYDNRSNLGTGVGQGTGAVGAYDSTVQPGGVVEDDRSLLTKAKDAVTGNDSRTAGAYDSGVTGDSTGYGAGAATATGDDRSLLTKAKDAITGTDSRTAGAVTGGGYGTGTGTGGGVGYGSNDPTLTGEYDWPEEARNARLHQRIMSSNMNSGASAFTVGAGGAATAGAATAAGGYDDRTLGQKVKDAVTGGSSNNGGGGAGYVQENVNRDVQGTHLGNLGGAAGQQTGYNTAAGSYGDTTGEYGTGDNRTVVQKAKDAVLGGSANTDGSAVQQQQLPGNGTARNDSFAFDQVRPVGQDAYGASGNTGLTQQGVDQQGGQQQGGIIAGIKNAIFGGPNSGTTTTNDTGIARDQDRALERQPELDMREKTPIVDAKKALSPLT